MVPSAGEAWSEASGVNCWNGSGFGSGEFSDVAGERRLRVQRVRPDWRSMAAIRDWLRTKMVSVSARGEKADQGTAGLLAAAAMYCWSPWRAEVWSGSVRVH